MLQRIEAGRAYRPADLERRATAILELLLGARPMPAGDRRSRGRRDGVASPAMAHVQTVLGPIEPDAARVHAAARAHPDRAVAHPGRAGTTGS